MEFERLELQIGEENIEKIKNTTVLIIGIGGVGGYAVESLIRSGIENIILVDGDLIEQTNLNRQIIALNSTIGLKKVDAFEKRILDINPNVKIKKIDKFITEENIDLLFENNIDFLIDACDTVKTKQSIIRNCINKNIQFISCMGMGRKLDITKIKIMDIRKTTHDPIAKIIRKMVKEEKINSKVMVVSSDEQPLNSNTSTISSNSFVPAVAGIMCTSYVINKIIGDSICQNFQK